MGQNRTLTNQGMTLPNALFVFLNIIGVGVTLYLTKHYFDVHFPTGRLGSGISACDISSFFNCDAATFSSIASIFGIPLSLFGLFINLNFIGSTIFPSEEIESTNKLLAYLNALGCVALFVYSLVVLKTLCPFCTGYYVISWATAFLFYRYSDVSVGFDPKSAAISGVLFLVIVGFSYVQTSSSANKQEKLAASIINQFKNDLKDLGEPEIQSPYFTAKSTDKLEDAPLWIIEFSDFQCPFCKRMHDIFKKVKKRYKGKINIAYFPFPLDNACNSEIKGAFHALACKASYLAICSQEKFKEIHNEIFENQANLTNEFLNGLEKKYGLNGCFENEASKKFVKDAIEQGKKYRVKSTPTMIINGKKIEGGLALIQFFKLFDSLLENK